MKVRGGADKKVDGDKDDDADGMKRPSWPRQTDHTRSEVMIRLGTTIVIMLEFDYMSLSACAYCERSLSLLYLPLSSQWRGKN